MNSYSDIEGYAVVDGYQPDGDTIRFVPDHLVEITRLSRGHLATPGADTSVPIRLEGIDAPELHFEGREHPAARPALDALLAAVGWPPPLTAKRPRGARVRVVTRSCDAHGRMIGYLMPAGGSSRVEDSVNASLLAAGLVYPLAYASQPAAHRESFGRLALAAREAGRGVWAHDRSRHGFALRSEASLGPNGALVFPKLFRRSVTFFREAARGVGFREWLREASHDDDAVRVARGGWRRLSDLLAEHDDLLRVAHDVIGVTFKEA